ncbi:MAG: type II toxin-antitoxin system RelE/ParE family toxin [Aristaeellaceae bacterium]
MSNRVRLTETAKQDLREIAFYIADQDKELARRFVNELRASCNRLTDLPQAGALPKDHVLRSMDYRCIMHKGYLIFYIVDAPERAVNILAIFSARKDDLRVMSRFI